MSESGCRARSAGFTLVEVLVALTIAAVALIASVRATGALTNSNADLRARTLAQWSAENRLSEIRVQGLWPNPGERSFDCSQGGVALTCVERVVATPNRYFRRIELNVRDGSDHRLAQLTGFATNLPR
ncbi:MAG: type II secretion system minor pseudopilin GspI [Burkholderiaceae bacterium]